MEQEFSIPVLSLEHGHSPNKLHRKNKVLLQKPKGLQIPSPYDEFSIPVLSLEHGDSPNKLHRKN
ncbi:MAG: hypothetical protein EAZ81_10795, partial [Verrucomicrobia bacterium]